MNEKKMNRLKILLSAGLLAWMCMLLLSAFFGIRVFNNDNYFMFAHAKVLLEEGFVTTEPLSMHEGLEFMIPQWLFALTLYLTKTYLGNTACMWFMILLFSLFVLIIYKTYEMISENKELSIFLTIIASAFIGSMFLKMRPFLVSGMLGVLEIYLIEKYIRAQKDKTTFLIAIALNSVLYINVHNSLWIFLFLIHLSYIGEWILNMILKREQEIELKDLVMITGISFVCGLINPYGIDAIKYIFFSMESVAPFMKYVTELQPIRWNTNLFFWYIFIPSFAIVIWKRKELKPRYFFLFAGTSLMAFMAARNIMLFLTAGLVVIPYLLRNTEIPVNFTFFKKGMIFILSIVLIFLAITIRVPEHREMESEQYDAIDWLYENEPNKNVKIFNSFDSGAYLSYKGFKPYIDPRIEVYGKANNKKADIGKEYLSLMENNCENFDELLEKYDFDYLLVPKNYQIAKLNDWVIKHPDQFHEVYKDDMGWIYKRVRENKEEDKPVDWSTVNYGELNCFVNGETRKVSEIIPKNGITVLFIGRDSCHTCVEDGPKLMDMISKKNIPCVKMDIIGNEDEPNENRTEIRRGLIVNLGIKEVPAFLIFKDGEIQNLMTGGIKIMEPLSEYLDEIS